MSRVAIFVDAASLYRLPNRCQIGQIDYCALFRQMAPGKEILRSYFYDALPFLDPHPTTRDQARYNSKKGFLHQISMLPRVTIRLGETVCRVSDDGKRYFEQKRVDCHVSTDLVRLSAKHLITDAAILAGDSDFIPAIDAAREDGVVIHLFHGAQAKPCLLEACDERTLIDDNFMTAIAMRKSA